MSQVDCVNLLAFIQIAVAFDFGLLCLKDSHIFRELHSDLISEMGNKVYPTQKSLERKIEEIKNGKNKFSKKNHQPYLERNLAMLRSLVDSQQANWGKYTILGLCAGIYGLIALLVIGMSGSSIDSFFNDFLLISAQLLLFWEFIALIRIGKNSTTNLSKMTILKKLVTILALVVLAAVAAIMDWSLRIFPNFQLPFILLTICVVYLPFFVFAFKVGCQKRKIDKAEKDCLEALRKSG